MLRSRSARWRRRHRFPASATAERTGARRRRKWRERRELVSRSRVLIEGDVRSVMQFVRRRRRPNASGGRTKRRVVALAVFLFVAGVSSAALAGASGSDGGGTVTVTVGGVEQFPGSTLAPPGRGVPSRTGPVCTWTQLSTEGVPG